MMKKIIFILLFFSISYSQFQVKQQIVYRKIPNIGIEQTLKKINAHPIFGLIIGDTLFPVTVLNADTIKNDYGNTQYIVADSAYVILLKSTKSITDTITANYGNIANHTYVLKKVGDLISIDNVAFIFPTMPISKIGEDANRFTYGYFDSLFSKKNNSDTINVKMLFSNRGYTQLDSANIIKSISVNSIIDTLNIDVIKQNKRSSLAINFYNKIGPTELQDGLWSKKNILWDSTKVWLADSLKSLNMYPSSGSNYIDSVNTFIYRGNSPYGLDGWKYAYGYNKRGGVTIRSDAIRDITAATNVVSIFEKYDARIWYVAWVYNKTLENSSFYREMVQRGHEVQIHSFGFSKSNYSITTLPNGEKKITLTDYNGNTISFTTDTTGTDSVAHFQSGYFNQSGLPTAKYSDWTNGGDQFWYLQKAKGLVAKNNQMIACKMSDGLTNAGGDLAYGSPRSARYGLGTSWDNAFPGLEEGETGTAKDMISKVADATAKHYVVGDHIHDVNVGRYARRMAKLDSLLKFCFNNQILVTGITDWVHIVLDMPHNPYVNIAPTFDVDLNKDGISDGWELSKYLTTADYYPNDGYNGDGAWELSNNDSIICGIYGNSTRGLYGWEEGINTIGLAIKGISEYDSVIVEIYGKFSGGYETKRLAFPVTSSWVMNIGEINNTFYDKTGYERYRTVYIYPKNGVVRISAPLIKKKY